MKLSYEQLAAITSGAVRTWADDICLVSGGHVRMMRKEELYDGTAESLL